MRPVFVTTQVSGARAHRYFKTSIVKGRVTPHVAARRTWAPRDLGREAHSTAQHVGPRLLLG